MVGALECEHRQIEVHECQLCGMARGPLPILHFDGEWLGVEPHLKCLGLVFIHSNPNMGTNAGAMGTGLAAGKLHCVHNGSHGS